MKIVLKIMLAMIVAVVCAVAANAQNSASIKQQINEAVLKVYNEELDKNPDDYFTLNGRANQYFLNGDYLRALDDIDRAIKLTPEKDTETRYEEFMLRAKIYDARGDQEKRIADLYEANRIDPTRINCLGLLAEANYGLLRYDDAEQCYQRILRIQPNNYEALAGLGRIEVQRQNFGKASEYVDRAVKLYQAEPMVYINRAEVLIMMEQYEAAAQDLISALSVGTNNQDAIEALTAMSDVQYDAVIAALNNSISKAPRNGMFYYLAAQIAMSHNHFADAEYYLNIINTNRLFEYHGIYNDQAKAQYALGRYNDALTTIGVAIRADDSIADYYVTRGKIQRAMTLNEDADRTLRFATTLDATNADAIVEQAINYIAENKNEEALSALNMAIVDNSELAEALILRAWLYRYRLEKDDLAKRDYAHVLMLNDDITSLRGFALHELARDEEALAWAAKIVEDGILPGGQAYYVAAAVCAACGNKDKAYTYLSSALANGYGNYHNLTTADHPVVNVASLKGEKMDALLKQYEKAFVAKRLTDSKEKE